jgi:hypothetical protein
MVFVPVQILVHHVSAFDGNTVLTGIASHDDGNVLFHWLVKYRWTKVKKKGLAFLYLLR